MLDNALSVFDLFRPGIGPSSSHTAGPMRAARAFVSAVAPDQLARIVRVQTELFGSLAATGRGHGTDRAILLGLEGHAPETIDAGTVTARVERIRRAGSLRLLGQWPIAFDEGRDLHFVRRALERHPNGMRFTAFDDSGTAIARDEYFSIGGGFIERGGGTTALATARAPAAALPYPFRTAQELLVLGRDQGLTVAQIVHANERTRRSPEQIRAGLLDLWREMRGSIERGLKHEGTLPGGLNVTRRAPRLARKLQGDAADPFRVMDWVGVWAMAVNEENAAGGRIVTAPTNGAAGLLPAVLHYYTQYAPGADDDGVCVFLLTAGAIGMLYKMNASISGAEVGCQGEVGVACSMAAAGLVAALGGTNERMAQAAEIGMEHHLGMTCDPVGGLVQIPCIERNAVGAVKAITAARMALNSDTAPKVSLDQVIETMRQTGHDMQARYKETALAGLALNVINC